MARLLSQALANAETTIQHLAGLDGLPARAVPIRTEATLLIIQTVAPVRAAQVSVINFTATANRQLAEASTRLDASDPLSEVRSSLNGVKSDATALRSQFDPIVGLITATARRAFELAQSVATICAELGTQRAVIQERLAAARNAAARARARNLATAASVPFGVGFLIAPFVLDLVERVSALEGRASALRAELSRLESLEKAIQQLVLDTRSMVEKIQGVHNAIEILTGDIMGLIDDLDDSGDSRALLKVFVQAAASQVRTLAMEGS